MRDLQGVDFVVWWLSFFCSLLRSSVLCFLCFLCPSCFLSLLFSFISFFFSFVPLLFCFCVCLPRPICFFYVLFLLFSVYSIPFFLVSFPFSLISFFFIGISGILWKWCHVVLNKVQKRSRTGVVPFGITKHRNKFAIIQYVSIFQTYGVPLW